MARTPKIKAATPNIAPETPAGHQQHLDTTNALAVIAAGASEERDLLNQLLGQAQMADAIGKLTATVAISKMAYVKENKLYRALAGTKDRDGRGLSGTWEEFCGLLGTSAPKVNEDITNLQAFGEGALESMSRMGIGYREMRQYRRLPEDEKTTLLELAKAGDKDGFVDLAETLIARHTKEREELTAKLENEKKDHKATEKVLTERTKKLTDTQKSLEKMQLHVASWDDKVAPFKKEITDRQNIIDAALGHHMEAVSALESWLTVELPKQPDYDPETSGTPLEVLTVIVHLEQAIERSANLIAAARHQLHTEFGADLAQARQHLLVDGE